MTIRENLFFIGECLTLYRFPERIGKIRETIQSGNVDWEKLLWISSNHLIIPAIYVNFKLAGLINDLPDDLEDHLRNITDLNLQRNQKILEQIIEISTILNQYDIHPVFLKGTAHLLNGLYKDVGERMIGDIDLLVDESDMVKVAEILKNEGYYSERGYTKEVLATIKHYPRLMNDQKVAAVEVHRQVMRATWEKNFDSAHIYKTKIQPAQYRNVYVPSIENQILHSIMNTQFNDKAFLNYNFHYRQLYDLFLLSEFRNPQEVVQKYGIYTKVLNANLALASILFNSPKTIPFEKTKEAGRYVSIVLYFQSNPRLYKILRIIKYFVWRLLNYGIQIIQSFYKLNVRKATFQKLSNPRWYGRHIKSYRKIE